MFALETQPTGLPFTTRTSLQALLKSRGTVSVTKRNDWLLPKEETPTTNFTSSAEGSSEILTHQNSANVNPSQDADLQNGDQNGDFSYSQKLFHIDDGNLYSIFSPLQGRSYGMKPSFLRKQKCTVQECHGRGRKILRKGLKFHNFLPSESVTSEKDNSFREDQWKVHSECKLREEHGTKQIMVSNWFQNVKHTREESSNGSSPESVSPSDTGIDNQGSSTKMENQNETINACNLSMDLQCDFHSSDSFDSERKISDFITSNSKTDTTVDSDNKFSFLNNLLHSVTKSHSVNCSVPIPEDNIQRNVPNCGQQRRRKPKQTRKVVPYTKYLSIMEETEASPLDLSFHTNGQHSLAKNADTHNQNSQSRNAINCNYALKLTEKTTKCDSTASNIIFEKQQTLNTHNLLNHTDQQNKLQHFVSNAPSYLYPSHSQKLHKDSPTSVFNPVEVRQSGQNMYQYKPSEVKKPISRQEVNDMIHHSSSHRSSSSTTKAKARRKSQRSVIKQKLEDTFRQNGFLVKTKQVSDGDATFCKFRQLRKYTRYYLKSWQQHLPDEVHKMWKGFLPPKTVLPPVSGTVHTVNENPT